MVNIPQERRQEQEELAREYECARVRLAEACRDPVVFLLLSDLEWLASLGVKW
jgi:hypothetical protein